MFTQKVSEHLNLHQGVHQHWFDNNDALVELISNPHFVIQPTLLNNARRVIASDSFYGRVISIEQSQHKWSYLLKLDERHTCVEQIKLLLAEIDEVEGYCCIKNGYLALELPVGYILNILYSGKLLYEIIKIKRRICLD